MKLEMDLVTSLIRKVQPGDKLSPERENALCHNLSQLSKEGTSSVYTIIKSYKEHVDKSKQAGSSEIPYYGITIDEGKESDVCDVQFSIEDMPLQLLLI